MKVSAFKTVSAVTEVLGECYPVLAKSVAIDDRFGTSGEPDALLDYYRLNERAIVDAAVRMLRTHD